MGSTSSFPVSVLQRLCARMHAHRIVSVQPFAAMIGLEALNADLKHHTDMVNATKPSILCIALA